MHDMHCHLAFMENGEAVVYSSPCREIVFYSNLTWCKRVFEGKDLTEARYTPKPEECFLRAEVVDADGKRAWSNIIKLKA